MKKIYMVFLVVAIATMITANVSAAATSGADSLSIGGAKSGENGQNVDILVNATNVSGVGTFQLDILYNESVISANDVIIGTGITGGIVEGSVDNANGSVHISGITGSDVGMEGSGTVATINFTVVGNVPDSTKVSIVDKEISNGTGDGPVDRLPDITNGTFTVTEQVVDPCEGGPDCTPPVTTTTNVTEGGVYNDNVTIKLNATDNTGVNNSGVNKTIYTVNGGATKTYTVPFKVDIVGDDNVTFWSTDKAGNIEPQNMINFTIKMGVPVEPCDPADPKTDCISPNTTISGVTEGATYITNKTVTLSAKDNAGGSGVASTEYMVNGGATKTYTVPFVVSIQGPDTVQARSTDKAGNVEDWNTVKFIINKTATPPGEGNGTIEGKVYRDRDHDKKLDSGESGMKNVRVRIRGLDDNNKNIKLKTHTNSKGIYEFSDLPDGTYSVHVSHKHGYRHTSKNTVKVTIEDGNTKTVNFGKRHK